MPLTDRQEHLLFELYGLTYSPETVVLGDHGFSTQPPFTEFQVSATTRLQRAILEINIDPYKVERVGEVLKEYEEIALDPSSIDREGYVFRQSKSIRTLKDRLYSYTGIRSQSHQGNRLRLG